MTHIIINLQFFHLTHGRQNAGFFFFGLNSEPSVRGVLTACSGISAAGGFFMIFLLGSMMAWRTAAIICLSIPLATLVAICFVRID